MRVSLVVATLVVLPIVAAAGSALPVLVGIANAPPTITSAAPCPNGFCVEAVDRNGATDLCPNLGHVGGSLTSLSGEPLAPLACIGGGGTSALFAAPLPETSGPALARLVDGSGAAAVVPIALPSATAPPLPAPAPAVPPAGPGLLANLAGFVKGLLDALPF